MHTFRTLDLSLFPCLTSNLDLSISILEGTRKSLPGGIMKQGTLLKRRADFEIQNTTLI